MTKTTTVADPVATDLSALKARQRGAWGSIDYAVVGTTLQIVGKKFCEALDLRAGQKVLDVATGSGNLTLAGAGAPTPTPKALRSSSAKPMRKIFYSTMQASTSGVMFTPDQSKAAAEMLRVCKPGGKIGLANWTPDGFIGQLFKTLATYVPPASGRLGRGAPRRGSPNCSPHLNPPRSRHSRPI